LACLRLAPQSTTTPLNFQRQNKTFFSCLRHRPRPIARLHLALALDPPIQFDSPGPFRIWKSKRADALSSCRQSASQPSPFPLLIDWVKARSLKWPFLYLSTHISLSAFSSPCLIKMTSFQFTEPPQRCGDPPVVARPFPRSLFGSLSPVGASPIRRPYCPRFTLTEMRLSHVTGPTPDLPRRFMGLWLDQFSPGPSSHLNWTS